MNHREATTDKPERPPSPHPASNPSPQPSAGQIGTIAKRRTEEIVQFQSRLLDELQHANRYWMKRMQSEMALASEFSVALASAHSIPEGATAYQHWAGRRMRLAAEDAGYMLTEGRKLMEVGARLFSDGGAAGGQLTGR